MSRTNHTERVIAPRGKQLSISSWDGDGPTVAPTTRGQSRLNEFADARDCPDCDGEGVTGTACGVTWCGTCGGDGHQ